ncbi:amidohydrolase [Streptomyces sp. J2-1]|uniref:amidohydrolase family protein n=1 Tax=Streptomyces corallincola TaxID=2851888 RepID=UPI001C38BD0A|nr:amidohydrolase family protein [Streptomyces corallincola]MBV2358082.1 amidohydrolase [Streptomyces corallincola]
MNATTIDVHAHYVPDFYRDALLAAGHSRPDGIKAIPEWSEKLALESMDRLGVKTSLLSISSPGVHFGDPRAAAELARLVNEEGARLTTAHPGRFGFFASLPLPDVDAAVAELLYALDELHADGIVLETNHHGVYLGDERLEPIYAEAARRNTVVFVHPTTPAEAGHLALGYPRPMLEFMFETTRSITDLVLSGVLERYPELKVIVPHAGAALPVLAGRIELLLPLLSTPGGPTPPSVRKALRQLHFDLAGAPVPELLGALLEVTDPEHLHYGSDFPFTPLEAAAQLADTLATTDRLTAPVRAGMLCGNAQALVPRLAITS